MKDSKKITIATVKSFIRKNAIQLYIREKSSYDAMHDGTKFSDSGWIKNTIAVDATDKHEMGINGIWFVGNSRDHFNKFEDELFAGYEVYNCCGTWIVGIRK